MDTQQIQNIYFTINRLLSSGRLKQAFDKTQLLTNELQNGEFYDRFNTLQDNYKYMLQYYVEGIDDPQRISIYNKLIAKLFLLNEEIRENLLFQNSTGFEYSRKRYFPYTQKHKDLNELFSTLQQAHEKITLLSADEQIHKDELIKLHALIESIYPELFGLFWLSTHLGTEEKKLFQQILSVDYPGRSEKSLLVSALTLNLWRMFDEEKLMLLFDCCDSDDQQVKQRALIGLCFILAKYNSFLTYFPIIRNRLVLMADNEHTLENFRNIITQIIGTTETEKISKKLQEEILPEIVKVTPQIKDKMDMENLLNSDDWEETNPQWQEMIEESGVSDKLKELSDLQLEGADVYMSTFAMLKSFPFFSETANWLLPFDPDNTAVHALFSKEEKNILAAFVGTQVMCNSDLYSFCLSILQMPEPQRDMMKQSFKMESEQLDEMKKDEAMLMPDIVSKNISKQYIQDLFRFFKLYPKRNDFTDMFDFSLKMHKTYLFNILSANSDLKAQIAEYYFSKKLYVEALDLYEEILEETEPTAALYQKIGYSYQKTSQLENALSAYNKADMIQPDDLWTIKKIALCYRLTGNFDKALEFYKHVDFLKPNQPATLMQIANCYLRNKKYKDALNIYYKLEAEDNDNIKILRAISWTLFASGNIEKADYYIQKILSDRPAAHDYLNAGHIAYCQHQKKTAVGYYKQSLEHMQNSWEIFMDAFNEDIPYLKTNGIDSSEIPLMLDSILY